MGESLPQVYTEFNERYPRIAGAQGEAARAVDESSPFDEWRQFSMS